MRGAYRRRRVYLPPDFQNFKPSGVPRRQLETMILTVDEFEALRLADYLGLAQTEAAGKMAISRPTFTRLIDKAHLKIARTIVEGMELIIQGGNVDYINKRRHCHRCDDSRIVPAELNEEDCPACGYKNKDASNTEDRPPDQNERKNN